MKEFPFYVDILYVNSILNSIHQNNIFDISMFQVWKLRISITFSSVTVKDTIREINDPVNIERGMKVLAILNFLICFQWYLISIWFLKNILSSKFFYLFKSYYFFSCHEIYFYLYILLIKFFFNEVFVMISERLTKTISNLHSILYVIFMSENLIKKLEFLKWLMAING